MRCKTGDLAVVIQSRAGNLGRFVTVGEYVPRGHPIPDGFAAREGWLCHAPNLKGVNLMGELWFGDSAVFPDDWLQPIRPDTEPKAVERERELVE